MRNTVTISTNMIHKISLWSKIALSLSLASFVLVGLPASVSAITQLPTPPPIPGSYGIEATKKQAPPSLGATITTPGNGANFTTPVITVSGICPTGLLVEVSNNGVMAGAVMCENGSFSLQVSLFSGTNELSAIVYDELDQSGPESNKVTVNYTDTNFTAFGELITLTSSYGRRSAPAGQNLTWPLQLTGGTGPYAFSIDWGDGSKPDLMSQSTTGVINIQHVYQKAGIYRVNILVTDKNGVSAFLQVVAVSSGQVDASTASTQPGDKTAASAPKIMWIPYIILLILLLPTYWLGRRSQLVTIRNKMLKEREAYQRQTEE